MVHTQHAQTVWASDPPPVNGMPVSILGRSRNTKPSNPPNINALAIVAHDLRGPLSSLSSLIELVESHAERQDGARVVQCTQRATDIISNLEGMLNSVLERVRACGDPLGLRPAMIDLPQILHRAMSQYAPVAKTQSVAISMPDEAPLTVWGDGQLLQQAVENLIGNAIKHSAPDETVTCGAFRDNHQVVIRVTNRCDGRSELNLQRAIRPFINLSSKTHSDSTSWGLGLWFVRLIAERHGGRININARDPDGNTVVSLILPA